MSLTNRAEVQLEREPSTVAEAGTVFVVDDDEAVRRSLSRLLRSAGWKVELLESAETFLRRLPLTGPGCLLLDVEMPGMSGIELQARMTEEGIDVPVVFLTGKGDIPMSVCAIKKGADDFLVKPFDAEVLFRALDHAMQRSNAEAAVRCYRKGIVSRFARLSVREREVLMHVLRGRLNKQIAADLGISEKTVKVHRGRVMEKMEARSLAQLVHMCDTCEEILSPAAR